MGVLFFFYENIDIDKQLLNVLVKVLFSIISDVVLFNGNLSQNSRFIVAKR